MDAAIQGLSTMSTAKDRISRIQGHLGFGAGASTAKPAQAFVARTFDTPARLQSERAKASFPVREMTFYLDGSPEMTALKEEMMAQMAANPAFNDDEWNDLSRAQYRERTLKRVREAYKLLITDGSDVARRNARLEIHSLHDLGWFVRQGVHFGLFMGALMGQGSEEQRAEWLPKTMMCEIYGCFAMTELGHGSFLRGLETTAHFDKETQEFIINSPTDTSTKWWIGAAGQTATHSVVFARLILNEGDVGVHNFIVPIRDMDNHLPLPGIRIGDVGAKMGLNGIDNGYIQYDHVRIPRDHMLSRYSHVTEEGKYVKPPRKEMAYGALIGTRAALIKTACDFQKKALMIAIRYGAIRLQGSLEENSIGAPKEQALLDYPMHQHKLIPLLAAAYAWHFQASHVLTLNDKLDAGLDAGDLSILKDVHGTMAGLKAFGTWATNDCIEVCRQSLGGHGYSKYNGLAGTLQDFAVMCTFEGDNTVMALQTARYLVKSYQQAQQGGKLAGSVSYLQERPGSLWQVSTPEDLLKPQVQIQGWKALLAALVGAASEKVLARASVTNMNEAFQYCQVDLFECARVHVNYNVGAAFVDAVTAVRGSKPELYVVLKRLCDLFMLDKLLADSRTLLETGFATGAHLRMLREQIQALSAAIRPDAVALVDAFNYHDVVLGSIVGAADGDIYHKYLAKVQDRVAESREGVCHYYQNQIKPLMSGEDLINTADEDM